jgi:hypothetical protein
MWRVSAARKRQAELGADYLTLNIDGTQSMRVMPQEMFDFLPDLIPAIQEVTSVPLAFDNPSSRISPAVLERLRPQQERAADPQLRGGVATDLG